MATLRNRSPKPALEVLHESCERRKELESRNFKERYLAGEVEFDEIYRLTGYWKHHEEIEETLAKFLGLNADEEDVWIEQSDEALQRMLDVQRKD